MSGEWVATRRIEDFLLINHCVLGHDNDLKEIWVFVPLLLYGLYG